MQDGLEEIQYNDEGQGIEVRKETLISWLPLGHPLGHQPFKD
jgi:hypothetical protein